MKLQKNVFLLFLILIFSITVSFPLEKLDKNLEKGFSSIQPLESYYYCKTIASKEFAGRLTGHEGYSAAAKWAAKKFKEWGLKPLSQREGYLQAYPSPYTLVDQAELTLLLPEEKSDPNKEPVFKETKLEAGKDFLPLLFSDSGDNAAELVFGGWGISAPELGYDDYAGLDVKGKFILCFRGTPDEADKRYENYDQHRTRMKKAKERGALGLFYIAPEVASNPNGDWIQGFTPATITEKISDQILKEKGANSADLKKVLQTYKRPISFPLHSKVHFKVASRHFTNGIGYNIVGYVEGSDSNFRKECLVVGGHFDHTGLHLGFLFPGADDNASGSAVVMEIAEAFSKLNKQPRRSVVFALFGGEEMGLQGSTYFVDHIPSQFSKVDSMFNFDMVGEGDASGCVFTANAPEFKKALEDADQYVHTLRFTGTISGVGVRSSDYAPFFLKGAACMSFHSNGPHLFYHLPGDTIYRINPDIMADIARLAFLSGYNWANR